MAALAGAAASGATGGAGAFAGALTGLSSATANLTGQFNQFSSSINQAARFVQALDPAIVEQLMLAFKDLDAVVGTALRPIIVAAIDIVRNFGGAIYGAMQQLAPIIDKMAQSISAALIPVFEVLADTLDALMPVFDVFADAVAGIAKLFATFEGAWRVVINVAFELARQFANMVAALFGIQNIGDGVKGVFESIKSALQQFASAVIIAAATIAHLLGANGVMNAIIKGLQPRKIADIRGVAVAEHPQFKAIEDLGRDVYLNAFRASAAGGKAPQKTDDFLKDILAQVEAIKGGKESEFSETTKKILAVLGEARDLLKTIAGTIPTKQQVLEAGAAVGSAKGAAVGSVIGQHAGLIGNLPDVLQGAIGAIVGSQAGG